MAIHQLRAGAPDKIQLYTSRCSVGFTKHDNTNLVDYTDEELTKLGEVGDYILSADEGDIKRANNFWKSSQGAPQEFILLPQVEENGVLKVIDYDEFVPKDSEVYKNLTEKTGIKYAPFKSYTIEEFKDLNLDSDNRVAYKTTTGSGSRGVLLIDPDRFHLGYKYREFLANKDLTEFIRFAEKENCRIMIQDLIPNNPKLTKCNVDFFIKNGKLIGYKWDKTDPKDVFTNWNFGWFIRNEFTEKIMNNLVKYLTEDLGIVNAIMNFEAFSDLESEVWLVEFNWRYSNSTFEYQAFKIDPIFNYINDIDFLDVIPFGINKFSRYWQCILYSDVKNFKEGK